MGGTRRSLISQSVLKAGLPKLLLAAWAGPHNAPPPHRHLVGGAWRCTSSSRAPGRVARLGRDMAALVEPLGLERGKRSEGPVSPLGSVWPRQAWQIRGADVVRVGGAQSGGVGGSRAERPTNTPLGVGGPRDSRGAPIASRLTSVALPAARACPRGPCRVLQTCPGLWSCWSGCSAAESCPRRSCRPCSGSCRAASAPPSAR